VLNDKPQHHNFHDENDEDWVKFYAIKEVRYTVKAHDLSVVCDVGITLRDAAGDEFTAFSASAGEDAWLDWECKNEGACYVKVTNENKNFGENTRYSLRVYQPVAPSLTVTVHGVVTDCNTGKSICDVGIKTDEGISALSGKNGSYLMPHTEGRFRFTAQKGGYSSCACPRILVEQGLKVNFQLSASGEPKCSDCCTAYVDPSKPASRSGGGSGGGSGVGCLIATALLDFRGVLVLTLLFIIVATGLVLAVKR